MHSGKIVAACLFLLMGIFFVSASLAQNETIARNETFARNSLYFEGFGNGLLYSINYDRLLSQRFALRVGFSYLNIEDFLFTDISFAFFPIMVSALFGPGNHKFELGGGIDPVIAAAGMSFVNDTEVHSALLLAGTVGYRYQRRQGGFLFRIGFAPLIAPYKGGGIVPLPELSLGVSF